LNSAVAAKIKEITQRCQQSAEYFIDNYCKVKHPNAGIIPFKLFGYQRKCLDHFKNHKFNLFSKTRQSGISTLCGADALWLAMFHKDKTVLIVSKRDLDAKEFMIKNIKFVHQHLPDWMRKIWAPTVDNEHQFGFANGSKITSLPSGPDTLRANSSSLNIIDEAAFCPHMGDMWAGGAPTLQHGGQVIVVSTSNGIGDWYWRTFTDAQEHYNEFNPIVIDWWDMDWSIEYVDSVSGKQTRIAPIDGIRKCVVKEERQKYGDYWSPWLEGQYRQLTEKGEDSKFRQEVLRDFLGSGNTVLSRETILIMKNQSHDAGKSYKTISFVDYVQPISEESYHLDFEDQLWIWNEPEKDHVYVAGVDVSSGEATDWSGIEIFDIITAEQVAELQLKVKPKILSIMADYLGRWYNNAFLVPERTGMGVTVCQDLEELGYPSIFRRNMLPSASDKSAATQNRGAIGYNTTGVGKPIVNKAMIDNLGDGGFKIKSHRLVLQAETYVHKGASKTEAEEGSNDDLIISSGLAFVGINMAMSRQNSTLLPFTARINFGAGPKDDSEPVKTHDFTAICPIGTSAQPDPKLTQEAELIKFTQSLIAPITDSSMKPVTHRKHTLSI
jgi:hypothetical protein